MKRTLVTALSLLAAATLGFIPAPVVAAEKTTAAENKAEKAEIKTATGKDPAAAAKDATKEAAGKPLPFTGKATAVDATAKTFSLNGKGKDRVFVVDENTKITKDGKPAALTDIVVGEEVTGSYVKAGEVQTAKSVKIGGKAKVTGAATTTGEGNTAKVKEGTAPVKGPVTTPTGAVDPAATATKSGAGAAPSSGAGPAVKSVVQPGGSAPAGAKKP